MPPELMSLPEWCRVRRVRYIAAWNAITRGELKAQRIRARWYVASDARPVAPTRTPAGKS